MTSQERSSTVDDLPYLELFVFIQNFSDRSEDMVDEDYDLEEALDLFDACYPIRHDDTDAKEVLNYICMGHNAPAELKGKFQ